MRISDWSSDVCSSDLVARVVEGHRLPFPAAPVGDEEARGAGREGRFSHALRPREQPGVVQPPSGPGFDERLLRGVMADHRSHGSSSARMRSEEHTSELQSLMRISYAVFCLKNKKKKNILTYVQSQRDKTGRLN